jgi:hypothetical protein
LVYQALQQVKDADTSPPAVPEGVPAAAVASDQRFDPTLSFIAELAIALQRDGDGLAFEVLSQLVAAANSVPIEAERARIGFDVRVFRILAPRDEAQTRQAAFSIRHPVTRVLALAAFYQWKTAEVVSAQVRPGR